MTSLKSLPVVETASLSIREMCLSDWRGLARFMPVAEATQADPEMVRRHVARAVAQQDLADRESFYMVAEQKDTGTLIADALIRFHEAGVAEVFWNVDKDLASHGYGTEIAEMLIALAIERLGAERVWCKVNGSQKVKLLEAKSAGLADERMVVQPDPANSSSRDLHVFAITARDYFDRSYG